MDELSLYVLDITMNSVRAGATEIHITLTEDDEWLYFSVSDNGCGMTEERVNEINNMDYMSSYKSYGLKNTVRRIKLFYGDKYGITVKSRIGEGTEIYVTIPYKGTA